MPRETFSRDARLRPALIQLWAATTVVVIAFLAIVITDNTQSEAAVLLLLLIMFPAVVVSYLSLAVFSQAITRNPRFSERDRQRVRAIVVGLFFLLPPVGPTVYYLRYGSDLLPPQRNSSLSFLGR